MRAATSVLLHDAALPPFAYCHRSVRHWPCGSNRRSAERPAPPPLAFLRARPPPPHGLRPLLSEAVLRRRLALRLPLEPPVGRARVRHKRLARRPAERLAAQSAADAPR